MELTLTIRLDPPLLAALEGLGALLARGLACRPDVPAVVAAPPVAVPAPPFAEVPQAAPPPAAKPQARPRYAVPHTRSLWSEQRDDLLRRLWPAGIDTKHVFEQINALPGPQKTVKAVTQRAVKLKLRRPRGDESPAAPVPVVAEPVVDEPEAEVVVALPKPDPAPGVNLANVRRRILERDYAAGTAAHVIAQRMNGYPGEHIEADDINAMAQHLGLVRPPAKPKPPASAERIFADYNAIRQWAAERGVPTGPRGELDIAATNARRRSLSLPEFVIETAANRGGRSGGEAMHG